MQRLGEVKHVLLLPDAQTWYPYSKTYALNEENLVDASGEIVYPPPRSKEVFEPMEVGDFRTEPLDNLVENIICKRQGC